MLTRGLWKACAQITGSDPDASVQEEEERAPSQQNGGKAGKYDLQRQTCTSAGLFAACTWNMERIIETAAGLLLRDAGRPEAIHRH
jgi:hypothetical protein